MQPGKSHDKAWSREHFRRHVQEMFGAEDTSGIELFGLIRLLANLSDTLECQVGGERDLTGARMHLLMRLLGEEKAGKSGGLTPTELSHAQRVGKNTISALLRGLEEQGLIQRNLDARDRRVFRIQLTDDGRSLIKAAAPQRLERMNQMVAGLDAAQREQLISLLEKMRESILDYCRQSN